MAWPSSRDRVPLPALAVGVVLAAALAAPQAASASAPYLERTVRYLQEAQNTDGGFAGTPGGKSDPDISAWAALGLSAAGINPQDQARPSAVSAFTYLLAHAYELEVGQGECAPSVCTTELERTLLVVDAAGTSAQDFGGVDLEARLRERQLHDGGGFSRDAGDAAEVNDTAFAILSLSPQPDSASATHAAAEWLIAAQNKDGGWPIGCPVSACPREKEPSGEEAGSEVDATAAAIEALDAVRLAGRAGEAQAAAITKGLGYLRGAQAAVREPGDPGGLPEFPSEAEANVASTAWSAQALWSDGVGPESWLFGGGNPLSYMVSMQQADGHIRYRASSDSLPVWMTAYVLPAFSGVALPIVDVPRNPQAGTATADPGAGGVSPSGTSQGVLAGGGGSGAPDFSHPEPRGYGHRRVAGATRTGTLASVAGSASGDGAARAADQHSPQAKRHPAAGDLLTAGTRSGGGMQPGLVRGVLLAARTPLSDSPTGLVGARAGQRAGRWLAIVVGISSLMLAILGAWLERRPAAPSEATQ